jgi:signal transduction histidine kinase
METIRNVNFINALMSMSVIIFIIGIGILFLNQHFQKNISIQKLKEEGLKSKHLIELHRSGIQAQEEERKRIAQDLHDELGSVISIMRMHLVILEQQAGDLPAGSATAVLRSLPDDLQNVRQLAETALVSIRSISHQLMPPQLASFGLVETLRSVTGHIHGTGELKIGLCEVCPVGELAWIVQLTLYRIVMELINNTIRHAGATEVTIEIGRDGDGVLCEYSDNGSGMPEAGGGGGAGAGGGLGHKSIEGRVSALEGQLLLGNGVTGGFHALIRLPVAVVPA